MSQINLGLLGEGVSLGGILSGVGSLLRGTTARNLPGGAQIDLPLQPDVMLPGGACIVPQSSRPSMRLPARLDVPVQTASGLRCVTYMNMGRPLVWSGDKRAARRWNKSFGKTTARRTTRRGRR
jgi:hypothetical protein